MKYLKVKDQENLVRDTYSNAIINTDIDGYNEYIQNYKKVYNEKQRIKNLEDDMSQMKNDLNEIKELLRGLSNGSK